MVDYLLDLSTATLDGFSDTDTTWGRMIFRDALPLNLVTTGKRAVTITNAPGANYTTHNYGAVVSLRLYSDHTRDGSGDAVQEDGLDRAWAMFGGIDQILHSPDPLFSNSVEFHIDRSAAPMESFDHEMNIPYVAVNYDVAIHTN